MEKQLKLFRVLSLKEIALGRVSVFLCSNSDSRASFWETYYREASSTNIKEWQNIIEAKMSELELPESLRKQIIDYVPPIGFEIRKWSLMHEDIFKLTMDEICLTDPSQICWTAAGAIDYRKTAEQIVSCPRFRVEERYEIASFYCMENYIPLLWDDLPEYRKVRFHTLRSGGLGQEFYWTCIQRGELSKLDFLWKESDRNLTSFHQWAFERAAYECNQAATNYFFHHLTSEEKEASLMRTVLSMPENPLRAFFGTFDDHSDILFYLLSVLTPEQQMNIVRARPANVLMCFLDWKRLHLFSENAGLVWTCITPDSYSRLIFLMCGLISSTDYYVPRLLHDFLEHCSLDSKKYFVDLESEGLFSFMYYVRTFFRWNMPESLRVMFICLNAADRVKLVSSYSVLKLIRDSLLEDKWQVVEVCLREAALSDEDGERLKDAFIRFFNKTEVRVDGKFSRFFEFLDNVKKSQKRKLEE